ncbi:Piso0_001925 [Millerozyma farinosa CBS 7064]|uniref:Sorting nexin-4 n=1 Tax=Pichia sorbitophila (strain ATCC MYA-4447 / BCRC 22081 / CBS 7064 / NBRC 10061 / NRRL Y-12695) TaxID=559304 RepID=G8YB81_PICSO|nr:Piso0_001925 [Millerozyma farinosa CBS 7064]
MNPDDQFTSIQWDREGVDKQDTKGNADEEDIDALEGQEDASTHDEPKDNSGSEEEISNSAHEQTKDLETIKEQTEEPKDKKETNSYLEGSLQQAAASSPEDLSDKYVLNLTVSTPLRDLDASSKPYISYLIMTETDNPSIKKLADKSTDTDEIVQLKVRRRYGDFKILRDCLANDYPQVLIPPLPSKSNFKYLTGDTFSTEFVHKRSNSLHRFLNFIVTHKILSQSTLFHLFISDSPDWAAFQKNLKNFKVGSSDSGDEGTNSGFTSNVVNKVVNEDLLTETIMNFLTPSKHKKETNKEILEISDKLKRLYENLIKLDKLFSKLNKKNHDLSIDYGHLSQQVSKFAEIPDASGAAGNESEGSSSNTKVITEDFRIFASSISSFSESWGNLYKYVDEEFLVSLKDCAKYIVSLTNLIELLHNKKIDLEVLREYLQKAKTDLENVDQPSNAPPATPIVNQGNKGIVNSTTQIIKDTLSISATNHIGSASTEGKVNKLKNKISQLENEISIQSQLVLELTNRIIYDEYPNWDRFNKRVLKDSLLGLCNEEISFYKGLINNWNEVDSKLSKRLEELT